MAHGFWDRIPLDNPQKPSQMEVKMGSTLDEKVDMTGDGEGRQKSKRGQLDKTKRRMFVKLLLVH